MSARRVAVLAAAALALAIPALGPLGAQTPPKAAQEAHGAHDAFATAGLAMAWAIRRGRDEATTEVVVRVVADASRYATVDVVGVDPFSRATVALAPPTPLGAAATIRVPRARFADHPRSEWRFRRAGAPDGEAPALLVYYQGVPDTTPEFDDAAKLDAYLDDRLARARRDSQGTTPR